MSTGRQDKEAWNSAIKAIQRGEVAVFPTETVYGLGADARSDEACSKIFALKSRPKLNPLIVHFSSAGQLEEFVYLSPLMETLISKFSPGPLTMILPLRQDICATARAQQKTVAIRIPHHPVGSLFLKTLGVPVAAPSVNLSGKPSATTYSMAKRALPAHVPIIDGGPCDIGLESTIVKEDNERLFILRPGSITLEEIADWTHVPVAYASDALPTPGSAYAHYRPLVPLYLFEQREDSLIYPTAGLLILDETLQGLSRKPEVQTLLHFSSEADYAHHLYHSLHQLSDCHCIIAESPPSFTALRDRLQRAASGTVEDLRKAPL